MRATAWGRYFRYLPRIKHNPLHYTRSDPLLSITQISFSQLEPLLSLSIVKLIFFSVALEFAPSEETRSSSCKLETCPPCNQKPREGNQNPLFNSAPARVSEGTEKEKKLQKEAFGSAAQLNQICFIPYQLFQDILTLLSTQVILDGKSLYFILFSDSKHVSVNLHESGRFCLLV